jgi:hypothetical protein
MVKIMNIMGMLRNHQAEASTKIRRHMVAASLLTMLPVSGWASEFRNGIELGNFKTSFVEHLPSPEQFAKLHSVDPNVDYSLEPDRERFLVHIPADYLAYSRYGLVVYIDPGEDLDSLPSGWQPVLDRRHLLFIAPLKAGKTESSPRRLGLAVLAAEQMIARYNIDPHRVYAAGWSGGARIASMLGFYQADVFHGTIQSCGSDFFKPVAHINGRAEDGEGGNTYGLLDATEDEVAKARQVRFVLITGDGDFRHGDVLDIYLGGFAKMGFQAKLIDVPGMGHDNADGATLSAALNFIEPNQ